MALTSRPSIPEVIFERIKSDLTEFAFNFFQDGISLDVSARTYKIRLKASGIQALDKAATTNAAGRVIFTLLNSEKTALSASEYQFFLVEILAGDVEKTLMAGTLRWSVLAGKTTGLVSAPDVSVNYITASQELMIALGVVDFGSSSSAASAAAALASLETVTSIQGDIIERQELIETNTELVVENTATAVTSAESARADRILAEQLLTNAVLGQNPLGDWNPATNTPTLAAVPPAAPGVPKGSYYRIGTTAALAPFSGKNFTSGVTNLPVGTLLIKQDETQWGIQLPSSSADADLNASKVLDSGKMTGVQVPELQYRHTRGEVEMFGNNVWASPKGVIMYEVMLNTVVFNRVRIPVYMATPDQLAVIRVYKAASYVKNPSLMTLMAEVTIPSGSFNSISTGYQTVSLPANIRLKVGEYCYVALWCDTAAKMVFRRWDVDSVPAPSRHIFLYNSTADQWNIVWTETNIIAGFAQASFDLSLITSIEKVDKLEAKVDGDLSGMKSVPSEGNKLYGATLADYQYIHERGLSELDGNGSYGPVSTVKGLGFYEPVSKPVSFNRVAMKMFMATAADVTVKVFSAKSLTQVIGGMTELSSVLIPSGAFNSSATGLMTVNLPSYVRADAGSYIFVFAYCATDTKLGIRYFNALAGSGTERHRFLTMSSNNANYNDPWAAGSRWVETSANFYAASVLLIDSKVADMNKIPTIEAATTDYTANGLKKSVTGEVRGAYIPSIQYQHSRGESEMLGNAIFGNAGYYGLGSTQAVLKAVTFNKVELLLYTRQDVGTVTVKIYKSAGFNDSFGSMTLLNTQDIPAISFNKLGTDYQVIRLDDPVQALAGEYIHVFAHCSVTDVLRMGVFTADSGAAPLRERFKYKNTNVGWDATWQNSSATLYSAPFRLSLVNEVTDKKVYDNAAKIAKNPRLVIGSVINAVVGVELSIYYDAIIFAKDNGLASPEGYSVAITCVKGAPKERYWRLNAVSGDVGTHSMTVQVYNSDSVQVASKTISLVIVAATNPAAQKYIVDEGDSTIADANSRIAMNENFGLMTGGVIPAFLGTAGANPNKSEAFGGSTFLGHVSQTMTITGGSRTNSLWNPGTSAIDTAYYKNTVLGHGGSIDLVNIQLGINDCRGALKTEAAMQTILAQTKTLVDAWLALNGTVKIVVHLPLIDMNVMWGTDKLTYRSNLWRLRELLLSTYDAGAYNARVFLGQAGICVDRYYGYRVTVPTAVARRYPELVITHTDSVHPRTEGYKEMGDAKFAQMLALLQ
jgi:hypothetical protein